MATKSSVLPIAMTSFLGTSLTTGYQAINAGGFEKSCILIRIVNTTDKDVTISFNGVRPHEYIPTGEEIQLSLQSNLALNSGFAQLKKGTIVYVKSAFAGKGGSVYLSGYFQNN